jgi:hypothetical protein
LKDSVIDDLQSFYGRIAAGDIDRVLAMFSGVPSVNTPLDGQVKGEEGFRAFAAAQRQWLSERKAHTGVKGTIITDERVVLELVFGVVWIIEAVQQKGYSDLWWILLTAGILMVVLAFWSSAQFLTTKAYILLLFSGIWALLHGVTDIIKSFEIRKIKKKMA